MGFVFVTSACWSCGRLFSYNPMRVPSIRRDGERKPVCLGCIEQANTVRVANGLDPITPHPEAYEACDERDLSW